MEGNREQVSREERRQAGKVRERFGEECIPFPSDGQSTGWRMVVEGSRQARWIRMELKDTHDVTCSDGEWWERPWYGGPETRKTGTAGASSSGGYQHAVLVSREYDGAKDLEKCLSKLARQIDRRTPHTKGSARLRGSGVARG